VLCRFVGEGAEEEWVSLETSRLRPPSENWDKAISGEVGEVYP